MPGETEDQKAIADEVGNIREEQSSLERRGKDAVERLSLLKSDLAGLGGVKETLIDLNSQIKTT
ncbi:MAG: hypothetical protein ABJN14_09950 [Paracoccaceae bacterium]